MSEPILFPDAELWLTDYLRSHLLAYGYADVYVGVKVPEKRKPLMVTVRRDGGASRDVRDLPRVGVNVWAPSEIEVSQLAAMVRALIRAAENDGPVRRVTETSGPSPIADAQPRRYMTFEFVTRGEALT